LLNLTNNGLKAIIYLRLYEDWDKIDVSGCTNAWC